MRKSFFWLILLVLVACCGLAAADTEYDLAPCPGSISVPDKGYIVLTPSNLDQHPDFVSSLGKSKEDLLSDWEERGVVLQAWTERRGEYLEIRVRQDDDSAMYYDLVNHPQDAGWKSYLSAHKQGSAYFEEGYSLTDVEKKQYKNGNYVLRMMYKRTVDNEITRGVIAKTVARGYTLVLDFQVINRLAKEADKNTVGRFANTLKFRDQASAAAQSAGDGTAVQPVQGAASAYLQITAAPPVETSSDTFTVEGIATPGAHIIGVLMRIGSAAPVNFTADANEKTGKFKMKVTLPEEAVWLMTLNVEINDKIVTEKVFDITTYKKTLLPVSLDTAIPETLHTDELVIAGTTAKGVTIQCIVLNGSTTFEKTVRTNGTGRFNIKVPTALEATYDITLIFTKKNFDTRRLNYTAVRNLSEEDRRENIRKSAVKPGYSTLVRNLDKYIGRTLAYPLYITAMEEQGDEWVITAAGTKNGDSYRNYIIFIAEQEPSFAVGEQHLLYGTCIGSYQIQSEEGNESFPSCDLLFYD